MSILKRDPAFFGSFNPLFDANSVFNDFFYPVGARQEEGGGLSAPCIDIEDRGDAFVVAADLPGVKKDDIDVSIKDGVLSIRATVKNEESSEQEGKIIRKERYTGEYLRRMTVGSDVSQSDVSAQFIDGVLKLTIAKKEPEAPKVHRISVQ